MSALHLSLASPLRSICFSLPFLIISQSCDLWSLGVIIYVMLCGYPPFYSKHHSRTIPKDMRKKIMTGSFDFPEDEWSQISEMAKDVVRKWDFFCFTVAPCWSSCWLLIVPTPFRSPLDAVRLLKVKPEERLTIEGVLGHPWLNCTEALDNILPSAQMMMDKVKAPSSPLRHGRRRQVDCLNKAVWGLVSFQAVVAGIQQAHAEQLANMRIQDLNISLKPLNSVNNPILRKRKLLGFESRDMCPEICASSYRYVNKELLPLQPKAQRRILHPWPRERRWRL